jgi:hypothetical protein
VTTLNLDTLKAFNQYLYSCVVNATGHTTGTQDVDISELPVSPEHRMKLAAFSVIPRTQPEQPQINMPEVLREEEEDIQRRADHARGMARLEQYADEQGLERTPANGDAVANWLNENSRHLSCASVDAAVQHLRTKLTWKQQPATEVLATLKDGSQQLRLDATEAEMKKASVMALQDLIKRRRTATNQQYLRRGSFGSRF